MFGRSKTRRVVGAVKRYIQKLVESGRSRYRVAIPAIKRYLFNWLVLIDLAINTLLAGSPYETISERCWRHRDHWAAAASVKLIDGIFRLFGENDHCKNAAEGDESQYEVWGK